MGHAKDLYAAAMNMARSERDAEDLVQETLLRAFAAWDRFDHQGGSCRAWLLRILTNTFINTCRRAVHERAWASRGEPLLCPRRRWAAQHPETAYLQQLLPDEVLNALWLLPREQRLVVMLVDLEGRPYREVASTIGCPLGTVMSRLHRARRTLESELRAYARSRGIRGRRRAA